MTEKTKKLSVYKWRKPQDIKWWEKILGKRVLTKVGEVEMETEQYEDD